MHTEIAKQGKISGDAMEHEVHRATFWGAFSLDQQVDTMKRKLRLYLGAVQLC
jgi:hypothetical protein